VSPGQGELVVVTGMTGAGRSTAAKELEDLGYYVVDNLPPELVSSVVRLVDEKQGVDQPVAVVVDVRAGVFFDTLREQLAKAMPSRRTTLLFLEADDDILVRRQEAARRPHPLQGSGRLLEAITRERAVMGDLRGDADLVIDTTALNLHQLKDKVARELRDGLKFTSFIPHPDIAESEVTGKQELVFFISITNTDVKFEVGNKSIDPQHFDPSQFKPQDYDPTRIDRVLKLGGVDEWTLQSGFVSHPFHIHVNPFQIVSITDPSGKDVSAPGAVDNTGGLDPQYLELELTESLIMQDLDGAIATMTELQEMGVQLSIDDFGTGYSSLSALKHFPIVRLKIDQSFVRELPDGEDDRAIAMAVILLGRKLNLKVIAEGVETESQLRFLRDNDCHEIQGYHFSRPVSPGEVERLVMEPFAWPQGVGV